MRGRHTAVAGLCAALTVGCAYPYDMAPGVVPPAGHCPAVDASAQSDVPQGAGDVRFYRAAERRDRELAARWCATVGPPATRQPSGARSADWTSEDPLTVVTWNMWIGGGDLPGLLREELGVDCASAGAGRAAPPFVLALQEVWRHYPGLPFVERSRIIPYVIDPDRSNGDDPDIVETAERCGLSLVYVPSARNGPDDGPRPSEDKGNAILSNLELSDPIAFDLPLEGGRKVAVAATVTATDGTRVRVVSVHLDVASTLVRTVLSGNGTRVRQAMGLVDGLARAEADGLVADATIVGADLNTWAGNESTLTRMLRAFPHSPPWDGLPTRGGVPTDHILFRSSPVAGLDVDGYERIENPYGSDHHPRRATVSRSVTR